jgi:hypothetical protein
MTSTGGLVGALLLENITEAHSSGEVGGEACRERMGDEAGESKATVGRGGEEEEGERLVQAGGETESSGGVGRRRSVKPSAGAR